jgi:hypothetical protein
MLCKVLGSKKMMLKRLYVWLAFAGCSAALGGCAGGHAAGGFAAGAGSAVVPNVSVGGASNFKTTFGGYFQIVGGNPPKNAVILGTSIGVDSTGDSSGKFKQTVIFTTKPNQIKGGTFAFTYADGSTLNGKYSGTSTPPNSAGYSDGSGKFTVTKGTGRFAKSSGRTGTWTVSVQIFSPGSSPAGVLNATFQGFGSP